MHPGANDRAGKTLLLAGPFDGGKHLRIGDMRAIPGQQEVHPVDRRSGNMGRVGDSFLRQREGNIQSPRQIDDLLADVEDRQPLENRQALAPSLSKPSRAIGKYVARMLSTRRSAASPQAGSLRSSTLNSQLSTLNHLTAHLGPRQPGTQCGCS